MPLQMLFTLTQILAALPELNAEYGAIMSHSMAKLRDVMFSTPLYNCVKRHVQVPADIPATLLRTAAVLLRSSYGLQVTNPAQRHSLAEFRFTCA